MPSCFIYIPNHSYDTLILRSSRYLTPCPTDPMFSREQDRERERERKKERKRERERERERKRQRERGGRERENELTCS